MLNPNHYSQGLTLISIDSQCGNQRATHRVIQSLVNIVLLQRMPVTREKQDVDMIKGKRGIREGV